MSLLLPEPGLLLWMVLIFAIVFFILAKWGFPVISSMIDKRNAYIETSLRKAEEAESRLSSLEEEHRRIMEQTRHEQAQLLKEASEARARMLSEAREEAQALSAQILDRAKEEIAAGKEAALSQARREIALLGVSIAEKILRDRLSDDASQQALLDRLSDEVLRDNDNS